MFINKKIIISIALLLAILFSAISVTDGGDFDVYIYAARVLNNLQNIYLPPFFKHLQYCYSPFFAFLLIPFSNSFVITEFVWLLLSFFMLYRIWNLIVLFLNFSDLEKKQYRWLLILTIILSFQFIKYNVSLIQITIYLLWSSLESLNLFLKNKYILGSFILALAISIKIIPIVIFPYLIYRKYFKESALILLFIGLFMFMPSLYLGVHLNNYMLLKWWNVINPLNNNRLIETDLSYSYGLSSLVPVYLSSFKLNEQLMTIFINASKLIVISCSFLFFRTLPFKKNTNKIGVYWEYSYLLLVIPMIFPQQNKYEFLFVLPMIIYLLLFFIRYWNILIKSQMYKFHFILFCIAMLPFSPFYGSDILGRKFFNLTQHFRILTIASLLVIIIALACNPYRMNKQSSD